MNRLLLFGLILLLGRDISAQSPLETYIQEALDNNIALQRRHLSYEKSLQALKEAKANFFPQFSLEARYSVARGGRTIDFPVGDLMNPVYQNLNLINQLGQSTTPDYPVIPEYQNIDNVAINFLRREEQETKFRVVMPVFNNAIWVNQNVQENLAEVDRINIDTYKKELSKEVKLGYFNYAKALEAKSLYENTLQLVQENLRTTQSLFDNHKLTKDAVYLAQAQVREVERQMAEADKNLKVAQSYFNFLLNKPFETPIEIGDDPYPLQEV
ncbi:MAG: TolC family protein, partial [Bacteroidota bacterium]